MSSINDRVRHVGRTGAMSVLAGLVLVAAALGCGAGSDESYPVLQSSGESSADRAMAEDYASSEGDRFYDEVQIVEKVVEVEVAREVEFVAEAMEEFVEVQLGLDEPANAAGKLAAPSEVGALDGAATPQLADRVIVRSVDADLVVADIPGAIESLEEVASSLGGWVIDSRRTSGNFGFVSMRVPAESLDEAMTRVRRVAITVVSESGTSVDVTDRYVDLRARLTNQLATEEALLALLARADTVEEALDVQRELSVVREQVERLQGQIKLIEQTAAYSLITLALSREPAPMPVDAGEDVAGAVGQPVRFRATFRPPEDIDNFKVTWNFGDGSEPTITRRTAPTQDEAERVTATVTHEYQDDQYSPYIVKVDIEGSGESGLAEGSDIVIVSISRLPRIEVFAGELQVVEAGERVSLSGSFTRPAELRDATYIWDFGDGTPPAEGSLPAGVTAIAAEHSYRDHRPQPYVATLTVRGSSEAGTVTSSGAVRILVDEAPGWTLGGWSAADTWRTIIRILSGVGQVLVTVLFWLSILSPVWIAALLVHFWRRRRASARHPSPSGGPDQGAPGRGETDQGG